METQDADGVRALSVEECWERLRGHPTRVGRVGLGGSSPDVLPVNYAVDGASVVFRTAAGKKLDAIDARERIAFEVDHVDRGWRQGWSVVLRGFAERIVDDAEVQRVRELDLRSLTPDETPVFVRIASHVVSGREITDRAARSPR